MEITGRGRFFTFAFIVGVIAFGATIAILSPVIFHDDSLLVLGIRIFFIMYIVLGLLVLLMDGGFLTNYNAIQKLAEARQHQTIPQTPQHIQRPRNTKLT